MPPIEDPAVLVGISTADDAAVYRIDDQRAIVQTVDFITPVVDTPYEYGQIAAANALSDVYAMGGRPLFALNIVCFPSQKIPLDVLGEILQGGRDKAREAGIDVVGGHSVEDPEPKYGLVVTGVVPVNQILSNAGAQPGDVLVLTKPLGSGILSTALKKGLLPALAAQEVADIMATLNRAAAEALEGLQVHALTDVTGFGLLGHLFEMVDGSQVSARINASEVPVLHEVEAFARQSVFPGGATRNLRRVTPKIQWDTVIRDETRIVLADPQTSGGLLVAIAPDDLDQLLNRLAEKSVPASAVIGEITCRSSAAIEVGS